MNVVLINAVLVNIQCRENSRALVTAYDDGVVWVVSDIAIMEVAIADDKFGEFFRELWKWNAKSQNEVFIITKHLEVIAGVRSSVKSSSGT